MIPYSINEVYHLGSRESKKAREEVTLKEKEKEKEKVKEKKEELPKFKGESTS